MPYSQEYIDKVYRHEDERGRYQTQPLHAARPGGDTLYEWKGKTPPHGRYWEFSKENMAGLDRDGRIHYSGTGTPRYKIYLHEAEGVPLQDLWADITPVHNLPAERLGYPTQKPEVLLDRIIESASQPGNLVLDPFCGCGTAVVAAQRLGRQWIGIDVTHLAVNLMRTRLRDTFGADLPFTVIGEPTTLQDAEELAAAPDKYQFQWALGLVGARPVEQRKGADRGVDGQRTIWDDAKQTDRKIIFSVKAGHTNAAHVRDLVGVLSNERAEIGVLISFQEPTRPMREAAASAGFYDSPLGTRHPRIQLVTVGELLAGKQLDLPRASLDVTLKRAPRAKEDRGSQAGLFGELP